jgi:hypothetical protein
MTPNTDRAPMVHAHRRTAAMVAAALVLSSFGGTACGIVRAVKKVAHTVEGNKSTMDAFTNKIKSGEGATFEVTYVTTGSSPTTVVYAVEPSKGLLFRETPSGSSSGGHNPSLDFIANPSGEYACSPPSSGSGSDSTSAWSCEKLPKTSAADYNNILAFYTPAHWVKFLGGLALAAGFAGDKVSSSTFSVNGFAMSCVDLVATGVAGTSKICTTAQDVLGYVKVAQDTTSFEITKYSSSPSASLFQLPPGATVTTIPAPTTTTTATTTS